MEESSKKTFKRNVRTFENKDGSRSHKRARINHDIGSEPDAPNNMPVEFVPNDDQIRTLYEVMTLYKKTNDLLFDINESGYSMKVNETLSSLRRTVRDLRSDVSSLKSIVKKAKKKENTIMTIPEEIETVLNTHKTTKLLLEDLTLKYLDAPVATKLVLYKYNVEPRVDTPLDWEWVCDTFPEELWMYLMGLVCNEVSYTFLDLLNVLYALGKRVRHIVLTNVYRSPLFARKLRSTLFVHPLMGNPYAFLHDTISRGNANMFFCCDYIMVSKKSMGAINQARSVKGLDSEGSIDYDTVITFVTSLNSEFDACPKIICTEQTMIKLNTCLLACTEVSLTSDVKDGYDDIAYFAENTIKNKFSLRSFPIEIDSFDESRNEFFQKKFDEVGTRDPLIYYAKNRATDQRYSTHTLYCVNEKRISNAYSEAEKEQTFRVPFLVKLKWPNSQNEKKGFNILNGSKVAFKSLKPACLINWER